MVDEELQTNDIDSNEDIEKRKPKPFRYITNLQEINEESTDTLQEQSIMTDEMTTSEHLIKHFESAVGVGDVKTVEHVLKKHKQKRDQEKDIGFV